MRFERMVGECQARPCTAGTSGRRAVLGGCKTLRLLFHDGRYILSVYWSITTLSTVGYGDWNPTTPFEMAFVVLYMLFVRPRWQHMHMVQHRMSSCACPDVTGTDMCQGVSLCFCMHADALLMT